MRRFEAEAELNSQLSDPDLGFITPQLCSLGQVYLASLDLSFYICETGIIMVLKVAGLIFPMCLELCLAHV